MWMVQSVALGLSPPSSNPKRRYDDGDEKEKEDKQKKADTGFWSKIFNKEAG